jgi:hypothetical protein
MCALPTDLVSKQEPPPQIRMAVAKVLLGEPPAAVAADLGCNVISLMRWVKAQRRELKKAVRASSDTDGDAPRGEPAEPVRLHAIRPLGGRVLPNDRPVEPEDSARVAAAYRAAEFDYSGRRIRPSAH